MKTAIEHLKCLEDSISSKVKEIETIKGLLKVLPNFLVGEDRYITNKYYSGTVNGKVSLFEMQYSCTCCDDANIYIFPYIEVEGIKIYTDPTYFCIGQKNPKPSLKFPKKHIMFDDWEQQMKNANIPEKIIEQVKTYFE